MVTLNMKRNDQIKELLAFQCSKRTKDLAKVIPEKFVAIIAHEDLDRVAAESLVAAKVSAVINTQKSISGRYPNGGPSVLLEAGIPLFDIEGDIDEIELYNNVSLDDEIDTIKFTRSDKSKSEDPIIEKIVFKAKLWSEKDLDHAIKDARDNIGNELKTFATNTLEYIDKEVDEFFSPLVLPKMKTQFKGRHCVVVVRGHDYKKDLKALKPYIKEYAPVIIAVDGGADALLELGLKADIIIGDFDSVTAKALEGSELIHHVHRDGRNPGKEELDAFGVEYLEFVSNGMSEDVAMLMAYEAGATLIVAVGTHGTMVELLDKGRRGMASTFLTRISLGPVLVDAKGVSKLYEGRIRRRDIALLVLSALLVVVIMVFVSEPLRVFLKGLRLTVRDYWYSFSDWFR
jgi:uncharacterized membrane-anchored protein